MRYRTWVSQLRMHHVQAAMLVAAQYFKAVLEPACVGWRCVAKYENFQVKTMSVVASVETSTLSPYRRILKRGTEVLPSIIAAPLQLKIPSRYPFDHFLHRGHKAVGHQADAKRKRYEPANITGGQHAPSWLMFCSGCWWQKARLVRLCGPCCPASFCDQFWKTGG